MEPSSRSILLLLLPSIFGRRTKNEVLTAGQKPGPEKRDGGMRRGSPKLRTSERARGKAQKQAQKVNETFSQVK